MMCRIPFALAVVLGFFAPALVHAAPFRIELLVRAGKAPQTAEAVFPAPDTKPQPRPVLTADVGTSITLRWTLRNTDQAATVKDVLVHVFVVKQDKPDQPAVPKLTKNVLLESALTMDFRPRDRTEGEVTFTVPQAGCYLIRVEPRAGQARTSPSRSRRSTSWCASARSTFEFRVRAGSVSNGSHTG